MKKLKFNKKGFSLIEILLVLGVLAAIMVTSFMLFQYVSTEYKTTTVIKDIKSIPAQVSNIIDTQGINTFNASPNNNRSDLERSIFSEISTEMTKNPVVVYKSPSFKSPFGGEVSFYLQDKQNGSSGGYYITIQALMLEFQNADFNSGSCMKIAKAAFKEENISDATIGSYGIEATLSEETINRLIAEACSEKGYQNMAFNFKM